MSEDTTQAEAKAPGSFYIYIDWYDKILEWWWIFLWLDYVFSTMTKQKLNAKSQWKRLFFAEEVTNIYQFINLRHNYNNMKLQSHSKCIVNSFVT